MQKLTPFHDFFAFFEKKGEKKGQKGRNMVEKGTVACRCRFFNSHLIRVFLESQYSKEGHLLRESDDSARMREAPGSRP